MRTRRSAFSYDFERTMTTKRARRVGALRGTEVAQVGRRQQPEEGDNQWQGPMDERFRRGLVVAMNAVSTA